MVLPIEYWPSIAWMQHFITGGPVMLEQHSNYQKQSLANRCRIIGANGPVTLSVPLVGGREQKALLKDVQIDNSQRWGIRHLRSIKSCYGKAPFFDHYFPKMEPLLLQSHRWLVELDSLIIKHLQSWLKLTDEVLLTQQYQGSNAVIFQPAELLHKTYIQVFAHKYGFVPGLCILDVLFCLGPQVLVYIQ